MKIALVTDLHAGHSNKTRQLHEKFFKQIKLENPDLLICNGDWISSQFHQLESIFKFTRNMFGDKLIILGVLGNHDYWEANDWKRKNSVNELWFKEREELFDRYDIQYLEKSSYVKDNLYIAGFDSWYKTANPPSNDYLFLPREINGASVHQYMMHRSYRSLDRILLESKEYSDKIRLCVTHFAPYTKNPFYDGMCAPASYMEEITEQFHYFIVGHSHQDEDFIHNGCRVINVGSDYDKPKHKILEL